MPNEVWHTELEGLGRPKRGKVRDLYDLGDKLLLVACDRISAYDHVLRPGIPGKGKILNQLTNFWFQRLASKVPNHLVATDANDFPQELAPHRDILQGRAVLVTKADIVPFECVARGFLAGSAFREYQETGVACGLSLPPGMQRADRLPAPVFTPATKAESGHDENVTFDIMAASLGEGLTTELAKKTLDLYQTGAQHAEERGLILADTKFEFGIKDGRVLLVDEVLTPDSSRYWEPEAWKPGVEPVSFDKQFVRNWLDDCGWDRESPPPTLPDDVVEGTLSRYVEAFRRITGAEPEL